MSDAQQREDEKEKARRSGEAGRASWERSDDQDG
jgi:hypothetical protein